MHFTFLRPCLLISCVQTIVLHVGANLKVHFVTINGKEIKLEIWDIVCVYNFNNVPAIVLTIIIMHIHVPSTLHIAG